jgi:hypothetical protein
VTGPLLHVGLHRTATTWWQEGLLATHPGLVLLDDHLRPWQDPVLRSLVAVSDRTFEPESARAAYRSHPGLPTDGRVPVLSAERLSGHPFSGGADALAIARRVVEAFPAARVLVGIREQAAWLESLYGQMVREGYPGTIRDFAFSGWWKGRGFDLDYLLLDRLVGTYVEGLGLERVLVVPVEDLRADPAAVVARFCGWLDLPAPDRVPVEVVNAAPADARREALRRVNRFRRSEANPFPPVDLFDRPAGRLLIRGLTAWYARTRTEPLLTEGDRRRVRAHVAGSNALLRTLTGLELPTYA